MSNQTVGKAGEEAASEWLVEKGYQLLSTNYRAGRNEIDLIAMSGEILIFVEVKTRKTEVFGYPEDAVGYKKEESIRKASGAWLAEHHYQGEIRYDIVAVIMDATHNVKSIFHIEDAFYPGS